MYKITFLLLFISPLFTFSQSMEIGTNFWARIDWTGELPFKQNVNFSEAWNSGPTDYLVNKNVWNKEFLDEIDFYTVLRFMDWLPTNKSPVSSWSERRLPTEQDQTAKFGASIVNYHLKMYDLYLKYLEAIDDYISVFAHYVNAGDCSDGNCWGAKKFTGQDMADAPKYRALYHYYEKSVTGTGFNKTTPDGIKIYPVPLNKILNVKSASADIQSLSLFSITGEKLSEVTIDIPSFELKIKTEGFNPGFYVLSVSRTDNLPHRKVLVKL